MFKASSKKMPTGNSVRSASYVISGDPVPLQRHRHKNDRVWDPQKEIKLVIGINLRNQHNDRPLFNGPLIMNVVFYMPIPKHKLKTHVGLPHQSKPDVDNLLKMVFDVANGIIYHDDSQICEVTARKIYDKVSRTEFVVAVYE